MVFEKIKAIISDELDVEEASITLETTFKELSADSLDLFRL